MNPMMNVYIGFIGAKYAWTVDDGSLYLDMIEQAQNGAWLLKNRFSPEIGPPRYLNSVWIVVGKLEDSLVCTLGHAD